MTVLNIPCIRSSHFSWTGLQGAVEHSSIRIPIFNRIYDDACDAGFAVVSDKSGKIMIFVHSHTDFLGDEEEAGWYFSCIGELSRDGRKITRNENNSKFEILVIND